MGRRFKVQARVDYNRGFQRPDNGALYTPKAVANCQLLEKEN